MNNRHLLITIGAVVTICAGVFFNFYEPYEETKDDGWSEAAIRNPFLAAQHYLEHDTKDTQVSRSLQAVIQEENIDTIVISNLNNIVSDSQIALLKDWVASGGHLILSGMTSELHSAPADFLNWLEVSLYENDHSCSMQFEEDSLSDELTLTAEDSNPPLHEDQEQTATIQTEIEAGAEALCNDESKGSFTSLSFSGQPEMEAYFYPHHGLYHPSIDHSDIESEAGLQLNHWFSSEHNVHFLQFTFSQGTISILSDVEIWQNNKIDQRDHAFLLTYLTNNSKHIRFVVGSNMPSLFTLMWRFGSEFIVSTFLLVIFWLLYRSQRFAPPMKDRSVNRRSIAEHFKACANFHWQHKDTQALLSSLQTEIEQLAARSIEGFTHLSKAEQCSAIATASGHSPAKIYQALHDTNITHEASFTEVVKTLQIVRTSLGNKSNAITENYS